MSYIVTCEHATNFIPEEYRELFAIDPSVLDSHRGFDQGAREAANRIAAYLKAPLFHAPVSRLLVDCNRSPANPSLFSSFTKHMSENWKTRILTRYYHPFRNQVAQHVHSKAVRTRVVHLSVHSFTPAFEGTVRTADIGLLYDPSRATERTCAATMKKTLERDYPQLRIRMNYPYRGVSDGHTTFYRKHFDEARYIGIEIEFNQDLVNSEQWKPVVDSVGASLFSLGDEEPGCVW